MKKRNTLIVYIGALLFSYGTTPVVEITKPETTPTTAWSREGEFLIDTNVVFIPGANSQYHPSVAFDGTNYLVLWEDDRNDEWDIYGARVSPSGTVLDPYAIAISGISRHATLVAVAFDGTNYLAVWVNGQYLKDIHGARVSPEGIVIDTSGIVICSYHETQADPSVAFDGANYLVVWTDCRELWYGPDIYGARVSPSGTVLDPYAIEISNNDWSEWNAAVAFDGTNYLVVYYGAGNIVGKRVTPNGVVLDPVGIEISTGQAHPEYFPSLAFDGTNYLVVWNDLRNGDWDIYGARVDQSGVVLDPNGIAISTAPNNQRYPAVVFDGANYLVVWEDLLNGSESDIYGAKVRPSGAVINTYAISVQPGNQIKPALGHGSADSVLITYSGWTDSIGGNSVNRMRIWGKFYPFVGIEEDPGFTIHNTGYNLIVYPNPFQNETEIRYQITDNSRVDLRIYDATGRLVRQWEYPTMRLSDRISWDGTDDFNRQLASGVYFLKLQAGNYSTTEKLLLIR